jgi:uncharacterized protein YigA (DUF484 family)
MSNPTPIVEAEVAEFLKKHPDFFNNHLDILSSLNIPHQSGQAVSLVERQMQALRQSNNDLKARFNQLMDMARQNENHFDNTKSLIIDLLDFYLNQYSLNNIGSLETLNTVFSNHFPKALAADEYRVFLLDTTLDATLDASIENTNEVDSKAERSTNNLSKNIIIQSSKAIKEHAPKYLNMETSFCGALTKIEKEFLFGDQADLIASCAIIPLKHKSFSGLIAIGNFKEKHFHKGMGTMFLDHIGEVIARILYDLQKNEEQQSIAI